MTVSIFNSFPIRFDIIRRDEINMEENKKISFLIPCYGSEKTVGIVIKEIDEIVSKNDKYDYEIIAINDHSPDNVWNVLKEIAQTNKKVKLINLAKNMNRPGALMAGMSKVTGDYIVLMDDDGQCPMENLWELIKPLEEGHDVAIAKYPSYKQSLFKSFGTIVNRKMTEIIMDKPKDMAFTNFSAMKRYIVEERVVEEYRLLVDIAYKLSEVVYAKVLDVDSIYEYLALLHVIVSWYEVNEGRLA